MVLVQEGGRIYELIEGRKRKFGFPLWLLKLLPHLLWKQKKKNPQTNTFLRSPCMRSQPLNIRTISHDIRNTKACPASIQNPAGLTMLPQPSLQTTEMLDLCHRRNCSHDTWLKTPKDQQMSHLHHFVRLKPFPSFKAFFFFLSRSQSSHSSETRSKHHWGTSIQLELEILWVPFQTEVSTPFLLKRKQKKKRNSVSTFHDYDSRFSFWMDAINYNLPRGSDFHLYNDLVQINFQLTASLQPWEWTSGFPRNYRYDETGTAGIYTVLSARSPHLCKVGVSWRLPNKLAPRQSTNNFWFYSWAELHEPPLELFTSHLDVLQVRESLREQGGWASWPPEVPANPNQLGPVTPVLWDRISARTLPGRERPQKPQRGLSTEKENGWENVWLQTTQHP